jgi:hypothetical protein
MNTFLSTFKILFLAISCLLCSFFAQGQSMSVSTQYNGHASDYYITYSWQNISPQASYHCSGAASTLWFSLAPNNESLSGPVNQCCQNYPSGSYSYGIGPSQSYSGYANLHNFGQVIGSGCVDCSECTSTSYWWYDGGNIGATCGPILAPSYAVAYTGGYTSNIPNAQYITIYWGDGSDIPSNNIGYNIYRGNTLIGSVDGNTYTFNDSNLLQTGSYTYYITTTTSSWGNQESGKTSATGSVTNNIMTATRGTLYTKCQLTWPNIATYAPNGIQVSSNGQQLAVVDKNATTYSDFSGVPGVTYYYSIAPIDINNNTPFSFSDSGSARPNGQIKGNVYSIYNAAVPGVTLYASANVNGNFNILDSVVTDASGYYEFDDLFYDTSAIFTLVPHKGSHKFNPDTLTRTLGLNSNVASGVNFTDTSVFTIKGTIAFTPTAHCTGGCYSTGVSIYSNGALTSGVTDANGNYSFAIQTEGTYVLKPVFSGHTFSPDSIIINVNADSFGVNFTDVTTDTLFVTLQGGCHNQVAYAAVVNIASANNYYQYTLDTIRNAAAGTVSQVLILPAQPYTVTFFSANASYNAPDPNIAFSTPISVDLTTRDSSTLTHLDTTITLVPATSDTLLNGTINIIPSHSDTTVDSVTNSIEVEHRADFVYHGIVTVAVPNFPLSTTCASLNGGYILAQSNNAEIQLVINEFYPYDSTTCPVDSGQIDIYDDVSDISGVQTVNFYNGVYNYIAVPGAPNIAAPYTKLLQFFARVGNASANWGKEIIVTGQKPHTQTFVTKTPELPFFILHAPPGNNSYSFLAQDSSVSYTYTNSYQYGGSAGAYIDANIGVGLPVPLTGIVAGVGVQITANVSAGGTSTRQTDVNTTFTATQQISTASGSNNTNGYTGHMGDVYYGGSFNMIYALTNVLVLNNCQVQIDTQLAWGANGLATDYVYTEDHILNTLIPQLQLLQSLASPDSALLIGTYINVWQEVVQKNHRDADTTCTFGQNISYSAGAIYDNTFTSTYDSTLSIDYQTFVNIDATAGVIAGTLDDFNNTAFGVEMNFQWNADKNNSTNVTQTKTFGYHLEDDNNAGNYYSINVNKDAAYGTPSFVVVAGASACPHWPGTQARDSVDLYLDNYAVTNVPINQTANFVAHIENESESGETRTYSIEAVPESNPNGAIISIGGQQINNSPANFTVAAGSQLPVILTVAAGPTASDYYGLQVSASSPCDGGEGNTITFEAHFQSTCSPIGLYTPSDNWLVNGNSHDSLLVIFSGYNAADSGLINIGLEYSTPGGPWLPATNPPIPASALTTPYYNFLFNVAALPDGPYQLRAYANCGSQPGGETYSATLTGTIDRSSLSLFGTPTPSDGVLDVNQNISVAFNGSVNCNQAAIYTPIYSSLVRKDNGQVIPDSVTCNGNELIIYTNPPSLIDSLENVTLTATISNVYDMYGNSLQQPITWSFMVSLAQIYWGPADLNINAVTGSTATASATMYNTGSQDTFTIIHMPSWLSTPQAASYIISQGTPASPSQLAIPFTASGSLNPGTYIDTVVAQANGKKVYLFVTLTVMKPSPGWSVNPANYQYSMNITTNYSTTKLNAPLSTDTRDTIAAFVGNQCRGVGGITYDPASNTYVAFITAYSNSVVGDTFTFRMWDAQPGIEYQAVETLPFVNDGIIGQPLAPYILHPAGEYQIVPMTTGWNWFSLNVTASDMSPNNILGSLKAYTGEVVKTQNSYTQYALPTTPGNTGTGAWQGTLTAFNTNTGYMVLLSHPDTLIVLGEPVTDTTITSIASGWNWIGFPRLSISTDTAYLRNANVVTGDVIKSQSQFAQYSANGWEGSLNYLYPTQGYKLRTANAFNFVVPPYKSLPNWNVNENQFEQNESVTTDLQFDGVSTTESHYLVGAFANGVCVGLAQPQFLAALNLYRVFMTIQGDTANSGQAVTFKVYDTDNDIEYTPTYAPISVAPDTGVGTVALPYIVNVETTTGINALTYTEGYSLLQNIPNPFSQTTSIQYTLPSVQNVSITLYDESGRLIRELVNGTQPAGNHTISFEQDNLQSGVYFYQMKAGDFVKTRKMMILQ